MTPTGGCSTKRAATGRRRAFSPTPSMLWSRRRRQTVPSRTPVYLVGPLTQSGKNEADEGAECFRWLDRQPKGSVLFVSFGSGGTQSMAQMTELALGLELSGQRFLWVVKSPSDGGDASEAYFERPEQRGPIPVPAGGVRGPNARGGPAGPVVGAAGGGAKPRRHRRLPEPLRVELDAGERESGGTDGGRAAVRRAAPERGDAGGGREDRVAVAEGGGRDRAAGGGGAGGEGADAGS
ncbi:hypothetical protein GW17_00048335 [Ensete ventricosum]|nr:hypothetical protein GW17_00048335 [Ensete ventricosum]